MIPISRAVRAALAAAASLLASVVAGCGGPPAIPPEQAAAVPVFNPSPDYKLKDVTLENEYQFRDKIGGISGPRKR